MLKIFKLLLAITSSIAKYINDKKLIDAGYRSAERAYLRKALQNVQRADNAIRNADDNIRKRLREKYDRE